MKKQTTLEWLIERLLTKEEIYDEHGFVIGYRLVNTYTGQVDLSELVNKAKQSDKNEKIEFAKFCSTESVGDAFFEENYNSFFKSE